jgi:hypothetical protein
MTRRWLVDRAVRAAPRDREAEAGDRGSITPLVIGMFVCLLLLTAGVTAAGSAFLAGQRLQRLCDGAVAVAVGAVDPSRSSDVSINVADPIAAANQYLQVRGPDVGAVVTVGAENVTARCTNEAPVTFGALFGFPTITRTVTATSQPIRRLNALGNLDAAPTPLATSEGISI